MRTAFFVLTTALVHASCVHAQSTPTPMSPTPVTKILAIGRIDAPSRDGSGALMRQEVSDTVRLYLNGKIEQWYSRKDGQPGVVFVMNCQSKEEAAALLKKLPLGVSGVMKFELIPVGPLSPLSILVPNSPTP